MWQVMHPVTWTTVFLAIAISLLYDYSSSPTRRGINPGILKLKLWPARILFFFRGQRIVEKAYAENKDEVYRVQTISTDRVVLPPKLLPELRLLPSNKLNASEALVAATLGRHNGVDIVLKDRQTNDVCRTNLTKSLPTLVPLIVEEVRDVLSQHLRECTNDEFRPYNTKEVIYQINLVTTSLVFGGRELSRNQEWRDTLSGFEDAVVGVAGLLLPIPEILRSLFRPLLPPSQKLKRIHKSARSLLFVDNIDKLKKVEESTVFKHFLVTSKETPSEEDIVSKLLLLATTALHTMTFATVQVLYDLCARPDYINELRAEVERALSQNDNAWDIKVIKSMDHMDSFFKESQRVNPPSLLAFDRIVMSSFMTSDGTKLHAGEYICMPAASMANDGDFFDRPTIFDGDRFFKLKQQDKDKGGEGVVYEFAGIDPHNIQWGSGRFTCPGRWYASAVMKIFVSVILLDYDICFPEGQTQRPENTCLEDEILPDIKQNIMLRRRSRSGSV